MPRIFATYRIRSDAASIKARADAIAVEQSVEMPVAAIVDAGVKADIVGRVESITDRKDGTFDVVIGLATATTGLEAGQLLNMLFGNTSIHDDVVLHDAEFPATVVAAFGGPRQGMDELRRRVGAKARAMTCSALKPQGLGPDALAAIAGRLAKGGLDYIKDDHGLADQAYSPFADRVRACARAIAEARTAGGVETQYVPSLSGDLDRLRRQVDQARAAGVDTVLVAPMIVGLASFHALVRANPDMAFMAHPAMAGAGKIAPAFLLGTVFRLLGASATIFPNHGGRFGYSPETCRAIATTSLRADGLRTTVPVPAGGMTVERVPEMLDFYGRDVMLLIGGGLLAAGDGLVEATRAFTRQVAAYAR